MFSEMDQVRADLEKIRRRGKRPIVFGSDSHGFETFSLVSDVRLREFEAIHDVTLPADYRQFLTVVGDGGAGPYYGIFRLGEMDSGSYFGAWQENEGLVGTLSKPFPLTGPWNDLTGEPSDIDLDSDAFDRQLAAFESRYWSSDLVNGAVPICHRGCALRVWLVVTGAEAGNIWNDDRADRGGLYPLTVAGRERVTFFQWYRAWLDNVLASVDP